MVAPWVLIDSPESTSTAAHACGGERRHPDAWLSRRPAAARACGPRRGRRARARVRAARASWLARTPGVVTIELIAKATVCRAQCYDRGAARN